LKRIVVPCAAALALVASLGPQAARAADGFPVTVNAANGRVTIPKKPRRIVILGASHTETVFALGAGRQVVAVDDQSNFPRSAPRTKLSSHRPNAEAVARYRPDLVISSTESNKLLPAMRRLRVPVLLGPAATHIGGAYEQMKQIGSATGHRRAADRLIARMKRRISRAVRSVPGGERLSVFHELTPDLYSPTSGSFIGRVYRLFRLQNIADEAAKAGTEYPQLSAEYVIASDPDVIVLADTRCCDQSVASVRRRPGWDRITAVRRGRVVALDDDIPSRWGPRIADFVEIVARVVRRART
jgi:iron complex transport system substrate-binding protein